MAIRLVAGRVSGGQVCFNALVGDDCWKVSIFNWQPTRLNKLLGVHWAKRGRMKDADKLVVKAAFADIPKAKGKRRVYVEIGLAKGQRAGDPDAYFKSLLDSLVACGMLKDDNRQWCELMPVHFHRPGREITTITLEDV